MRIEAAAALVNGHFVPGCVDVEDGLVRAVGMAEPVGSDLIVPGFVDLQVNGFAGVDFSSTDGDGYKHAEEAMLATGVTAYQPTLITAPPEELLASLDEVPNSDPRRPRIIGVHLEGPFLSPKRVGAHSPDAIREPDLELLGKLLAGGRVTQMTLAPELPGALDIVAELVARGITASCGHSDATAAEAHLAFDRGATAVTHLFNAMRPVSQRDPGIAMAALARPDVSVQLIVDNHHLAPDLVRVAHNAATDRFSLVTDAISAATMGDGEFTLGGTTRVQAFGGVARHEGGGLAGSTLTMIEAVRNLHRLGISLERAVTAATEAPARIAGRPDLGRIAPGMPADLVVMNDRLEIDRVMIAGGELVAD